MITKQEQNDLEAMEYAYMQLNQLQAGEKISENDEMYKKYASFSKARPAYLQKRGIYSYREYLEAIVKGDEVLLYHASKLPSRQNLHEGEFFNTLRQACSELEAICKKTGSSRGTNATYVQNGKLSNIKMVGLKSVDFIVELPDVQVLIWQRHTTGIGGGQDNARLEIENQALHCTNMETGYKAMFVCDGDFYTHDNCKKLDDMQYKHPGVIFCTSDDVKGALSACIKNN